MNVLGPQLALSFNQILYSALALLVNNKYTHPSRLSELGIQAPKNRLYDFRFNLLRHELRLEGTLCLLIEIEA